MAAILLLLGRRVQDRTTAFICLNIAIAAMIVNVVRACSGALMHLALYTFRRCTLPPSLLVPLNEAVLDLC